MIVKLVSSMIERGQLVLHLIEQPSPLNIFRGNLRFCDLVRCLKEYDWDWGAEVFRPTND